MAPGPDVAAHTPIRPLNSVPDRPGRRTSPRAGLDEPRLVLGAAPGGEQPVDAVARIAEDVFHAPGAQALQDVVRDLGAHGETSGAVRSGRSGQRLPSHLRGGRKTSGRRRPCRAGDRHPPGPARPARMGSGRARYGRARAVMAARARPVSSYLDRRTALPSYRCAVYGRTVASPPRSPSHEPHRPRPCPSPSPPVPCSPSPAPPRRPAPAPPPSPRSAIPSPERCWTSPPPPRRRPRAERRAARPGRRGGAGRGRAARGRGGWDGSGRGRAGWGGSAWSRAGWWGLAGGRAGQCWAGRSWAGRGRAGRGRARQHWAGRGRAGRLRAGRGRAGERRAGRGGA